MINDLWYKNAVIYCLSVATYIFLLNFALVSRAAYLDLRRKHINPVIALISYGVGHQHPSVGLPDFAQSPDDRRGTCLLEVSSSTVLDCQAGVDTRACP